MMLNLILKILLNYVMKNRESLITILLLIYLKIKILMVNKELIGIGEFCRLFVFMSMIMSKTRSLTMFISISIYNYNYIYN